MARLGDFLEQIRGVSYKPEDIHNNLNESSIALLRANNIRDGQLNFDDVIYIDKKKVRNNQLLQAGDILICTSSGSKDLVGKAAYVQEDMPMTFGAFCKVIRPQKVYAKYLGHFFNSPYYRQKISDSSAGANINNIRNEHIDELDILVPDEEKQQYIIAVLDKVSDLISLRKQQLAKLDELVKARFMEMFGDPETNPLGWKQTSLKDIGVGKLSYGSGASSRVYDGDIRYVRITDIDDNGKLNNDIVSPSVVEEKYLLNDGDILFARSGATVGKTYRYHQTDGKCLYAGYLIRLIPDQRQVLPDYVFYYTKTGYYENFIASNIKVVAQPNINAQQYGDLIICVPPLSKQQDFVKVVQKIDRQKLTIQQSLDKLEVLKKSLMQEYFG